MRILLCHPDAGPAVELAVRLHERAPDTRVHHVRTLTEAYNVTEHRVPDHLMIAASLADLPEAELLFALAKLLGVHCIRIMPRGGNAVAPHPTHIASVALDAAGDQLLSVLKRRPRIQSAPVEPQKQAVRNKSFDENSIILIGASTGGIDALIRVLRHWSIEAPPTLIVQHTGASHMASLVRLLNGVTDAQVGHARDGELLTKGHVYLADGRNSHLCLKESRPLRAALVGGGPVSGHCPSVDMLFQSALPHAAHVTAALLTGMGKDGAEGLVRLRASGATTIGQDEATSVVYGMPRIAKERGGVMRELPIDRIGPALLEAARKRTKAA